MQVFPESKLWNNVHSVAWFHPYLLHPFFLLCYTNHLYLCLCVLLVFPSAVKNKFIYIYGHPIHTSPLRLPNPCHILIQTLVFYSYCSALYFSTNISWKSLHAFPDLLPLLLPSPSPFFFCSCIVFLRVDAPES